MSKVNPNLVNRDFEKYLEELPEELRDRAITFAQTYLDIGYASRRLESLGLSSNFNQIQNFLREQKKKSSTSE